MGVDYTKYSGKEFLTDVVMTILMAAGAYAYWVVFLLILSFVLVSIWQAVLIEILMYAIPLAAVTEIAFIIHLVRKRRKEEEMRRYTQGK